MIFAVDFDDTIVDGSTYPKIGPLLPYAKETINWLHDQGNCIIIWTCRVDNELDAARKYLLLNGVKFDHINENCSIRIEMFNNDCRKIGADIFIDDKSIHSMMSGGVNWIKIREWCEKVGIKDCKPCDGYNKCKPLLNRDV